MKLWIMLGSSILLCANFKIVLGATCSSAGAGPQVPVEVKRRLALSCEKAEVSRSCLKQANDKKLVGEARINYVEKCFRNSN